MMTDTRVEKINTLRIFFSLLLVYAFFTNDYLTTNDASRFSMTVAIVETGQPEIGRILPKAISDGWKIKDYARVGNSIYSEKAPLGAFLAIPAYFIASRAGLPPNWIIYFTSLFTAGLFTALTAVVLYKIVHLWVFDERRRVLIALAYGAGTMALVYGTVFFSHGITAFLCIASFYCFALLRTGKDSPAIAALGGFLCAAAFTSDYFSAISGACLLGYAAIVRKQLPAVLLGFAVPIALLLVYNNWVFGSPWPLSYSYSFLYEQLHSEGVYGLTIPTAENIYRLRDILLSRWGFLFANIIVLFGLSSIPRLKIFRIEAVMIGVMTLGYLYLNSCESWLDAYSARFFMPLLPFLMIPLIFIDYGNRWLRNGFFIAVGFSVFINFVGADYHLREFMLDPYRPGLQNLAGMLLGDRLAPGFKNMLFVIVPVALIWLIPVRTSKSNSLPENVSGDDS